MEFEIHKIKYYKNQNKSKSFHTINNFHNIENQLILSLNSISIKINIILIMISSFRSQSLKKGLEREQKPMRVTKIPQLIFPRAKSHSPHHVFLTSPFKTPIHRFNQNHDRRGPTQQILGELIKRLPMHFARVDQIQRDLRVKFRVHQSHHMQHLSSQNRVLLYFWQRMRCLFAYELVEYQI